MSVRITIGVDPGVHFSGVAYAENGVITRARNHSNEALFEWLDGCARNPRQDVLVLAELPQTYGGRAAGSSDANVLIEIARVVGRIEQLASRWKFLAPTPAQWKGQVSKSIMCRRIYGRLSLEERAACDVSKLARARLCNASGEVPDSATHPLDAVGLILWAEKRLGNNR